MSLMDINIINRTFNILSMVYSQSCLKLATCNITTCLAFMTQIWQQAINSSTKLCINEILRYNMAHTASLASFCFSAIRCMLASFFICASLRQPAILMIWKYEHIQSQSLAASVALIYYICAQNAASCRYLYLFNYLTRIRTHSETSYSCCFSFWSYFC